MHEKMKTLSSIGQLHIAEYDIDALMLDSFHERFVAGQCEIEGVCGRLQIDTRFEQHVAVEEILPLVSSDKTRYEDHGAARDEFAHKFPHRRS